MKVSLLQHRDLSWHTITWSVKIPMLKWAGLSFKFAEAHTQTMIEMYLCISVMFHWITSWWGLMTCLQVNCTDLLLLTLL